MFIIVFGYSKYFVYVSYYLNEEEEGWRRRRSGSSGVEVLGEYILWRFVLSCYCSFGFVEFERWWFLLFIMKIGWNFRDRLVEDRFL